MEILLVSYVLHHALVQYEDKNNYFKEYDVSDSVNAPDFTLYQITGCRSVSLQ